MIQKKITTKKKLGRIFRNLPKKVLDLTNGEVVIEIRYAPATILFLSTDIGAAGKTSSTPTYTIDNY